MPINNAQIPDIDLREGNNTEADFVGDSESHRQSFEKRIKKMEESESLATGEAVAFEKSAIVNKEEAVVSQETASPIIAGALEKNLPEEKNDPISARPAASAVKLDFPDGFLWGTSTSAYQVEGGNINDWSYWEKEGRRMLKIMEKTKDVDEFICGQACDSYNRYEEDFDLALALNNNSIRFGIEWSRVERDKKIWNVDEIKHYRAMLRAAKSHGLKTVVTLWHWTLPAWLAAEGGLAAKDFKKYFDRYVAMIIGELGGDIDYWLILNEPMMVATNGYLTKKWPPNKRNIFKYWKVLKNLAKVHVSAYDKIHDRFPDAKVGFSNLTNFIEPVRKWFLPEIIIASFFEKFWNEWFINKVKDHIDYIGISYYFHDRVVFYPPFVKNENREVTDLGWEIYPEGLYQVLKKLGKYDKPIIITENGLADEHDKFREGFIKSHLQSVHRAIREGVQVKGYFHWSLLDNFEWAHGYGPKFGLYAVDRKTFERKARPSAAAYAKICGENAVDSV